MNKLKETKLLGFPLWMFLILFVVMIFVAAKDIMLSNMVGALCFALVVGTLLGWVGDHIPVWNTWFGGGMLFTCLAAGALNTFNLIGQGAKDALNTFNGTTGFLDLYILVLITGSVLSVDRKMLIRSFAGYIPTIIAGVACALGLAGIVGAVTGVGALEAIMTYAIPIMGGGNGAGIQPMSKMWAAATGGDASTWFASAFAIISLGNLVAVFCSALLNKLGQAKPSLTGNGQLMKGFENVGSNDPAASIKPGPMDYATGLVLGLFCYNLATLYANHISIINNHLDLGFTIHQFAFMVILVAILNISNILPPEIRAGAKGMQMFFVKYMSFPLMITVGIGTNLSDYAKVFTNPANLLIIIATVAGAMIGTYLMGMVFKFYPVESMLTAGLCMANGGGSGDVQCLGAANRMEMMSYAQISSRIGGAIMLVVASFFFGRFL
ncbi:2-hydroxycarboxylate transporter family protein [Angelakisella massiliensis]|uniref:2-hydroxycarboxylate transporter family protein n=1 Tax=Angelakisella massiliensis TaxID=1871018 RepID=UPI0008F8949A|nr:2-hydroxycarboxylate transporter family protein [Angelakisella massiliensis]